MSKIFIVKFWIKVTSQIVHYEVDTTTSIGEMKKH